MSVNNLDDSFIGWIFLTAVILSIATPLLVHYFYKGCTRKVRIVKKRETKREFINFSKTKFNDSNYKTFKNKTIDLIYDGKKAVHTLNCSDDIFARLHVGAEYIVVVRLNCIIKLKKSPQ